MNHVLIKGNAEQDRQRAEAREWMREHVSGTINQRAWLLQFYNAINDRDFDAVRAMSNDELNILCNFAMNGFMDATLSMSDANGESK